MAEFLSVYIVAVIMFAIGYFISVGLISVGLPWLGSMAVVLLIFTVLVQATGKPKK